MVRSLQKEIQKIEGEIERNRETLKTLSLQSTREYQLAQTHKTGDEIANIEKAIKEKSAYLGFQNDEIKLKTRILKMLENDLIEAHKDHLECINLIEEHELNLTIQKISVQKTQERIQTLADLKQKIVNIKNSGKDKTNEELLSELEEFEHKFDQCKTNN